MEVVADGNHKSGQGWRHSQTLETKQGGPCAERPSSSATPVRGSLLRPARARSRRHEGPPTGKEGESRGLPGRLILDLTTEYPPGPATSRERPPRLRAFSVRRTG